MMLTDLANVLRKADLSVIEQPGWKTRGHGPMTDVQGVTCHHTASGRGTGVTLGLGTVQAGRPGLAGPLAHLYLNRGGTFYVVAAGLCWHAGESREPEYLNAHRIGIEALAAGDGWSQDWPAVQLKAYARGCRALADHYGFTVSEVLGHKETCWPLDRKVDPSFDMTAFRRMVAGVNLEEVVIQQTDIDKIAKAVAKETVAELLAAEVTLGPFASSVLVDKAGNPTRVQTVANLLQWAAAHGQRADAAVSNLLAGK